MVNKDYEIHLDLQSWIIELNTVMIDYAKYVGDSPTKFSEAKTCATEYMQKYLFNENTQLYSDYMGS